MDWHSQILNWESAERTCCIYKLELKIKNLDIWCIAALRRRFGCPILMKAKNIRIWLKPSQLKNSFIDVMFVIPSLSETEKFIFENPNFAELLFSIIFFSSRSSHFLKKFYLIAFLLIYRNVRKFAISQPEIAFI